LLAWSLAGLSVAMFVGSVPLYVLIRSARVPSSWEVNLTLGNPLGANKANNSAPYGCSRAWQKVEKISHPPNWPESAGRGILLLPQMALRRGEAWEGGRGDA
jgi:hypothetical protein